MTQAIIFTNDNGGVSVCIPTGEISIEAVQAKDTPKVLLLSINQIYQISTMISSMLGKWMTQVLLLFL